MKEYRFVKKRFWGIAAIVAATLISSLAMGSRMGIAFDEAVMLFFLDFVFLAVFIYFLEEERLGMRLPGQETNDFREIAIVYILGMAGGCLVSFLPEYCTAAFAYAVAMSFFSNREIALVCGIYLDLMLAFVMNQDIHVLASSLLLTILGTMVAKAARELTQKQVAQWVQCLVCSGTVVTVIACEYAQYLIIKGQAILTATALAAFHLLFLAFAARVLIPKAVEVEDNRYLGLLQPEYPLVQSIKQFSEIDYSHAKRVSDVCGECAKLIGLDEELCRTAGFYYRIGRMEGEPYIENGVALAQNACFPEDLVQILREYNGELHAISSRESAVVHMVDRVMTKLDLLDKRTFSTNWNQDMVIYQTLNEDSSAGMYDESGLSMNQFLRIRDFLVKGDRLF